MSRSESSSSCYSDSPSDEAASTPEPEVRKRKRSSTVSSPGSSSRSSKRAKTYESPSTTKLQLIKPTHVVCLYEGEYDHLPAYIKIGGQNGKVLKHLSMKRKENTDFVPPLSLTAYQERHKECIFACAEVMLKDLTFTISPLDKITKWEDNVSNGVERLQKSVEVEKKFHDSNTISRYLSRFYESLIEGYASFGLQNILQMCIDIFPLGDNDDVRVASVGGSSMTGYDGSIGIAKCMYHFDKDCTEEDKRSQAVTVLNCEKAEIRGYVPDLALSTKRSGVKGFFMFAECKVLGNKDNEATEFSQIWHQALRGLLDQDHVYGCVTDSINVDILKLKVDDDALETYHGRFKFSSSKYTRTFFNLFAFKIFITFVMKVIQENMKEK